MAGSRAKIFGDAELESVLALCDVQERTLVLATFRAGLRAVECARLDWAALRTPTGELAEFIDLPAAGTKGRSGQARIPMTRDLRAAMLAWSAARRHPASGPVFCGLETKPLTAHAIVCRLTRLYARAGLRGSSHSGRRSYGTALATKLDLRSLQVAMRHAHVSTTLLYLDPVSDDRVADAIRSLGC
jgi:integrase/recombinase XerC